MGQQHIELPHAGTTNEGYRYWKLKDHLIKVIDVGQWVKLVFLSIVAEQLNEKEVKVVLYEKCPGSKKRIRKSYISYPEAKKVDLVLQK